MSICVKVNGQCQFLTAEEIASAEFDLIEKKFKVKIKKKNQGKFRDAAKAAGMSTLEYARHVLSDPDASAQLKKRANFARNTITKWNK
jgi:hypothetical protein